MVIRASNQVGKDFEIYKDEGNWTAVTINTPNHLIFDYISADPVYPEVTTDETPQPEAEESLLQKVYVHTSILPNDHIVPDKEDDVMNESRRDNNPAHNQSQKPAAAQQSGNLEQQVLNALKQFIAKSKNVTNNAPVGNAVTANRVIRRKRVPVNGNRNGRMF